MATQAIGAITSSDSYYKKQYSARLHMEGIVENPVNRIMMQDGIINREDSLAQSGGGTVYMYNQLRLDGTGVRGDVDFYSNAILTEKSVRELSISKVTMPITWPLKGTQTQQYSPFDIGQKNAELLADWTSSIVTYSLLNQAAGNNASTITALSAYSSGNFTGSNLTTVTGNNAATAPTYWYEANSGGVITTDSGVNSGNTLTIRDFQIAQRIITSQNSTNPTWQLIKGKPYIAVAFMAMEGFDQLCNDAVTLGQGFQLSQVYNANLAGGKIMDLREFIIPSTQIKAVVVPNSWMPRGVTTSGLAQTANTRRCVIVGRNALDLSFGAGFQPVGEKMIPGTSVQFDTEYKRLNNEGYGIGSLLWGVKKSRSTGPGNGNSTEYDMAAYVITHYSTE